MVTVKVFQDNNVTFVKVSIKKSYGHTGRPAVIKFADGIPNTGHCVCPLGLTGICCHILSLLHFYAPHRNRRKISFSDAEHLQKWHKKGKAGKGSIPMLPIHKLVKVASAGLRKVKQSKKFADGFKTGSTDVEKSRLKREIELQMASYENKFEALKTLKNIFMTSLTLFALGGKIPPEGFC